MIKKLLEQYLTSMIKIVVVAICVISISVAILYYLQKKEVDMNRKSLEHFANGDSFCLGKNPTDADLQNFTQFMSREFDQMDFNLGYMENIFEKTRADFLDTQKELNKSNKITQQAVGHAHQATLNHLTSVNHVDMPADEQKALMTTKSIDKTKGAVQKHANMTSQQKRAASLKAASSSIQNRGASSQLGDTKDQMADSQSIVIRTATGETNKTNSDAKNLLQKACRNLKKKKCPPIHNYKTGEIEYHGRNKVACLKASLNSYIDDPEDDTYHGFTYDNIGHASCPNDKAKFNKGISKTVSQSQ